MDEGTNWRRCHSIRCAAHRREHGAEEGLRVREEVHQEGSDYDSLDPVRPPEGRDGEEKQRVLLASFQQQPRTGRLRCGGELHGVELECRHPPFVSRPDDDLKHGVGSGNEHDSDDHSEHLEHDHGHHSHPGPGHGLLPDPHRVSKCQQPRGELVPGLPCRHEQPHAWSRVEQFRVLPRPVDLRAEGHRSMCVSVDGPRDGARSMQPPASCCPRRQDGCSLQEYDCREPGWRI